MKVMDDLVLGLASATEWLVVVVPFIKRTYERRSKFGGEPMTCHGAYETATWTLVRD